MYYGIFPMIIIVCSYDELWELLKPYYMQWYQLGIKFGVDRRNLQSLTPYGWDIRKCLELMLKVRLDKCEVTWLDAVTVLTRQLAKPHS